MTTLRFSKMHGLGNDYVVIDESEGTVIPEDKNPGLLNSSAEEVFLLGLME